VQAVMFLLVGACRHYTDEETQESVTVAQTSIAVKTLPLIIARK